MLPTLKKSSGEIYIGVIIAMGIFLMLSQAIVFLSGTAYELIGFNRARVNAELIASQKIELLRNLPFNNVGTVGGIPSGPLAQSETITQNGLPYKVKTAVVYVDDTFDGVSPTDLTPNDYKRASVEVSWSGLGRGSAKVSLVTDVAPKGVEQTLGGGTLSILVFDSNGLVVPQATVTIKAPTASPSVDLTLQTNDNGRIVLPGAPACSACYQITATKSGFSTDRTYSTTEVANPSKPNLTVLVSKLTETSFAIDQNATINLISHDTRENAFALLPSQSFSIHGTKVIGTTSLDQPVYKYSQTVTTNTSGQLTISNVEWDNYTIDVATASGKTLTGTKPLLPLVVGPGETINLAMSLATKPTTSLLGLFVDSTDNPIASVSARITQGVFEATVSSGLTTDPDYGYSYFDGINAGTYTLSASASGYQPVSTSISVSGNKFEKVVLNP